MQEKDNEWAKMSRQPKPSTRKMILDALSAETAEEASIGKPENHKGCLCNQAADTKEAAYKAYEGQFGRAYGFWIPVAGAEEYIIHFGVGSTFEYPM